MTDENKTKYDPQIAKMLETRQTNASRQDKDYSHVFRQKTYFEILRLSAFAFGTGFIISAETAFVSPTLLQIGVDHSTMTMVWGLSPALGLLLGPLIGSISDQCRLKMGRRRPVLLVLFVTMVVGLVLLPYGRNIGRFFGDDYFDVSKTNISASTEDATTPTTNLPAWYKPNLKFAVIFTILATILVDFSVETSQSPARAYILDVCIPQDQGKVISTFSVLAGLGCTIGYAVGGINWETTPIGYLFGGNIQAVFTIDTICMVVCFCITIFSFSEIPLPLIEKDEMLRPLTAAAIKNEASKISNAEYNSLIANDKDATKVPVCHDSSFSLDNIETEIIETVPLTKYLKSIIVMPRSMWILSLTNLLSWMGHICYCLYFTDFVGEAVFHGDPTAPEGSEEYKLYDAGVRFGGWGMAMYAMSCSIYSFNIERLMIWFNPKYVYVFGLMTFAMGMFILAAWPSKEGVLILSVTAGIVYSTSYTVPFIIVANYHAKSCFEVCKGEKIPLKEPRGLGTDMAIISSMLFIAQLVISLGIGFLVSWTGTTSAIFYAASGASVCAAISAMFVLYI